MLEWIKLIFTLLIIGLCLSLTAQSRQSLEAQRRALLSEIRSTSSTLKRIQENKATALEQYVTLQSQINKRKQLIENLRLEITYTDENIDRTKEVVEALQGDIERLEAEFAVALRLAYRQHITSSDLFFLFSAESLNEMFRRWRYLQQYEQYRKKQATLIYETQAILSQKLETLAIRRQEKIDLLASQERQQYMLGRELKDKDQLLSSLKKGEKSKIGELEQYEQQRNKLDRIIQGFIKEEITIASSAAPSTSSKKFASYKKRLPWPIRNARITKYFGEQPHPTLAHVKISNNGIDLSGLKGAAVSAVFPGEVVGTQFVPGHQNMVILKHGNHYTVYSNIEELYVKRGDTIDDQQEIGRLGNSDTELHFEVWEGKKRLNPVSWLK